ncbi:peptidoglycan-binding protein [Streptomyces sp. NPDC006990]|uniref:peptidoglycan-binding protein n=1 Tax=Streptomyces sp. NPDC006990 TaxID=3154481 RepID=UPI003451B646
MDSYWRFGHGGREPDGVLVPGEGSGMAGDGRCPGCGRSAAECTSADRVGCGGGAGQEDGPEAGEPVPGTAREPASADPLHIRPYVRLLGSDPVRAPEEEAPGEGRDGAPAGVPEGSGPPTVPDVHADAHVPLPGLAPLAAPDTQETAGLPDAAGRGGTGPDGREPDAARPDAAGAGRADRPAADGPGPVRHRRMAERRRPSTAVFAGVGVAAVLGGGLLTTQLLTDDGSRAGDGRALRHMPTGAPDEDPHAATPSATPTPQRERPEPSPSRSSAPATPRAGRDSGKHTASPSPSGSGREEAAEPTGRPEGRERVRPRPERPERPAGKTLRPGDSGVAVVQLQRRLKQAGYYDLRAEEDGVYSSRVQEAVFRYQAHYRLWDDAPGEYGPATRRHLEARTSG